MKTKTLALILLMNLHNTMAQTPPSNPAPTPAPIQIGWASCDITPPKLPVVIAGQFHVRLSEGVENPLTATALAMSSGKEDVVFVSVDLVNVPNELREEFRKEIAQILPELNPQSVVLSATHSHSAPEARSEAAMAAGVIQGTQIEGFPTPAMTVPEYRTFAAEKLAQCVKQAWEARQPGRVAYGLDYAVVGWNRRWVGSTGKSYMYGLKTPESKEIFRNIEGHEDHSVNLLATYDSSGTLTGVVVNLPSPSQDSERSFLLSSDFWHETRQELARRLGDKVFLLPQCSAAGDQTSHLIHGNAAHDRMLELRGKTQKQEIGQKIADAVERILPVIAKTAVTNPVLHHEVETLDLPAAIVTPEQAADAEIQSAALLKTYEEELQKLAENPSLKNDPRWYVETTKAYRRASWNASVKKRFDEQQAGRAMTIPNECHFVRLGDIAFASNPFEYFLDYGIQIKVRSPFTQTFLVQLAGAGTYVPSPRAAAGGGYGAVSASSPVGPEGGQVLAEETVARLNRLFALP